MILGYNTNGLAHHDPIQAIELLAELGYRSVALTLDHCCLNPFALERDSAVAAMQYVLEKHEMRSVVETGARFLLDPRDKHEPTLVSPAAAGRARRVEFLHRAIDVAHHLNSDCVSFWSGVVHDAAPADVAWARLIEGLGPVIDYAGQRGVTLGFEPEPGMFIDTMTQYAELVQRLADRGWGASHFALTLDIGHLHCLGETPLDAQIVRWGERLVNVHLEDMRRGVHEHLMFGQGEIDFAPVFRALRQVDYGHGIHVELSRHSHEGATAARRAMDFLRPLAIS